MQKLILPVLAFCCALLLFGCQKEVDPRQGSNTGGSSGNSSNAGASYYPLTKDSWWKYKDSLTGMVSDGKVLNRTKTINGIVHTAIVPVSGPATDTGWLASPRPNYYMSQKGINPDGVRFDIMLNYLNDTASVGYTWRYNAGSGNGFAASVKGTILQKGMSITVAGKKYNDVIQTRLELSYDILGTMMDFGFYDYYTAKGIGIVKISTELSAFGAPLLKTSTDLIDYSIK